MLRFLWFCVDNGVDDDAAGGSSSEAGSSDAAVTTVAESTESVARVVVVINVETARSVVRGGRGIVVRVGPMLFVHVRYSTNSSRARFKRGLVSLCASSS